MIDTAQPATADPATRSTAVSMLDRWAAERHDGLIRKSLVIDNLLDLRAELGDDALLKISIDDRLSSIPGRSVVEPQWWVDAVAGLRAELDGVRSAEDVSVN